MRLFGRNIEGIPRLLVIFSVILLIGSGLCGITVTIEDRNHWSWFNGLPHTVVGSILGFVGVVGYFMILISGVGIIALLVMWPIVALYRYAGRSSEKQHSGSLLQEDRIRPSDEPERDDQGGGK